MISRHNAKQVTLGAQVASLMLAVGAVAVAAVGLPVGEREAFTPVEVSPPEAPPAGTTPDPSGVTPDHAQVDFDGIVSRFEMVRNAPKKEDEAPKPSDPGNTQQNPTPTESGGEVRYLGLVQIGSRRSAMLVIDNKQKIVSQGGAAKGPEGTEVQIQTVQPEFVLVNVNGKRTRIAKSEKQASSVTTIERTEESVRRADEASRRANLAAQGRAGESPDAAENPRADFERRRREAIDRALEEGRITQEDAQRMLDRLNNAEQRRGRDD